MTVFPETLFQRWLVHKERNRKGYLSTRHWSEIDRLFRRLRKSQEFKPGREALAEIEAFLRDKNQQARQRLEEAREQLLTLLELDVPNTLNRSLLSTHCIENLFKNLRRHIGGVCRWRKETDQADRWMASGLHLASEGFRKINGYREIPAFIKALEWKWAEEESRPKEAAGTLQSDGLAPLQPCRFAASLRGRPTLHEAIVPPHRRIDFSSPTTEHSHPAAGNPSEFFQ